MGSTVGHHCCCVERKCYDNRKNVCVGVPFKLVILFGDIFSRIFYFYQYGVHTHNEFFLGPTHHHTAIFFLRQRSLEGGPTCAGHMGSTLILFSCLFQTSSGSFIFSTDGGWGTRFMKYDHLFFTPQQKNFYFNFKSRTRSGRRRWSRFWLFYFSTRFLCRIGQLISWETDRTAVAYLSGWCLMCLFEVNGAWLVARWIKTDTHTKMISTACFWLLPLWPTGVK